ncbi:hypothetical protein BDV96DRAFT_530338 [Lophiotrema nucula]|uniref:AB hydrolase-1 domain-containing protein n=1 Tax=Lophiotrema nucula TaxID=690887 RepID=A0A6A5YP02_9PLEO|nr:hypothetical protein BDV96DRAFT_530338 [Lophiotrema nucula]
MMFPLDPGYHLYTDVSPSEQQRWIKKLRKCPGNTQRDPLTQAGYLEHPVTYLFCEGDAALPLEVQKMMVEGVKAMGGKVEEESCEASHSPFLSMPERVLEVVEKAAKTA